MILYSITDRHSLDGDLLETVERQLRAGVDYLQIREKDLTGRDLLELTRAILSLPNPVNTKVLINGRIDIALATGAAGVHLPSGSFGPKEVRSIAPPDLVVAVSTHNSEEVTAAEQAGADFAVFGPVFSTPSKVSCGCPQGLEALGSICRSVSMPVLALGGIALDNAAACIEHGAAGIAGISLFQGQHHIDQLVGNLRQGKS